ncbi:MAG: glycosyltransferase [Candidatus Thalassarchaeaceae archaeon]|nr:glycosyltransferase [Candidatus Thalassarchaeaceae archaeon]
MTPTEWLALGQIGFGSLAIIPFVVQDWLNRRWISKFPFPTFPSTNNVDFPKMTVIICVRDEEMVIEGKLADLATNKYPQDRLEVLVIDTGSSDRTMQVVEGWISTSPEFGSLVRLLSTTSVAGKSAAVNLGLAESHLESEIILLTDADSRLSEGALERIGCWFLNPDIGAVCGRQQPIGYDGKQQLDSGAYRTYYNRAREAESRLDSTPIFEGSLAAYRRSAINAGVVADSNADDSQLALEARKQGLRAIHDPELHFYEAVPVTPTAIHTQRVRRAQGLVRHLWRNSNMMFSKKIGTHMRMTLRSLFYIHVKMPFCVILSLTCGLALLSAFLWAAPMPFSTLPFWLALLNGGALLFLAVGCFSAGAASKQWWFTTAPFSFIHAMFVLVWVHLRIALGIKSHIWKPIQEIREAINRYDELK